MLQKNRSNSTMHLKFALIIPILITFVFTFNTKVIAQQKKMKTIEIHENMDIEIITKDATKGDLEKLKTRFESKGVTFKYKKLKYNSKNEITSIDISVKNDKGNQSSLSQNGTEPIKPIQIKLNNETGAMSLGNLNSLHESNLFFTSRGGSGVHKKVIVKKGEYIVKVESDNDLHIASEKGDLTKIWISKNGDSTKMKRIEIIEIDEDSDGPHKIIVKSNGDNDEHDVFVIKSGNKIHSGHGNMVFIDSDGKKPLFIVDGKEIENGKMEDIDPNNIEKMEVFKGEKAIEKYGEKAKDGVILITTKK